jgi:hypothetical protein
VSETEKSRLSVLAGPIRPVNEKLTLGKTAIIETGVLPSSLPPKRIFAQSKGKKASHRLLELNDCIMS